ncbi:glycosyltransferase family 2 protein [Mucilaginibacter sp. UR6-1]|uniref:glycosyltransferase n=1 Tax=Mucilaginibacter sp. UR6-1 TaxID=1435643 RepID=UPI001E57DB03|nr:glycosyltransferase [Mucilaginibacter sp. UR6-1]MCC8409599.1 glycosyltransferase family 2 protein [Mucilaginibacter sp. UR6-1]
MSSHTPYITIIIPTFNDWDRLALCLGALAGQTYPVDRFEIIVANNNANDKVPDGYDLPGNCKVITESKPGSYAARNAALKIAKGEILGFTDSDCIPYANWISTAVNHFNNHPQCYRIGGSVELFYQSAKLTKAELYESVFAFNQERYVNVEGTSITANMFTKKEVFDAVGVFDDTLMSGGDYEWGVRALKGGFGIDYVPELIIKHPARHDLKEIANKARRVGGGQAGFQENKKVSKLGYMIRFVKEVRPTGGDIRYILKKGKNLSLSQKLDVFFVRYYLKAVRSAERYKVLTGKKASRF